MKEQVGKYVANFDDEDDQDNQVYDNDDQDDDNDNDDDDNDMTILMIEQVGKLVAFISSLVRGNTVEPEVGCVFLVT